MNNNRIGCVLVAFFFCAQAFGDAVKQTDAYWNVEVGTSDPNGVLTNTLHWSEGVLLGAKTLMHFQLKQTYEVDFPAGSYTNAAEFMSWGIQDKTVTFDGTGRSWLLDGSDTEDVHSDTPFTLRTATADAKSSTDLVRFSVNPTADYRHPVLEFSDFKFSITGDSQDPKVLFDGGTYNFRDPGGAEWTGAGVPWLLLGDGHKDSGTTDITFRNADTKAWKVCVQGCAPDSFVTLDGGTHVWGDYAQAETASPADYYNALASRSTLILTNGANLTVEATTLNIRANKDVALKLYGKNTEMTVNGVFAAARGAGIARLNIEDGATLRLNSPTVNFTSGGGGTNYVSLVDGHLILNQTDPRTPASTYCPKIGMVNAAALGKNYVQFHTKGGSVSSVRPLYIDGQADIVSDGTDWALDQISTGASGNAGGHSVITVKGGTMTVTNVLDVALSGGHEMIVSNGTLVAYRYINVGSGSGSRGVLTVAGGTLDNHWSAAQSLSPLKDACCLYTAKADANSYGEFNVTGGEVFLYNLYAAWLGHGAVNVSGGKLTITQDLRVGCNKDRAGTDTVEDTFTVTGGEVDCRASTTKIGQTSPCKARLNLNGGVFMCKALQGGSAAKASGGAGNAALSANGGTLKAQADSTAFVLSKFDEMTLGADGLTIDTAGCAVTIDQDITGTGALTLTGGGTVTFTAGNTVSVPVKVIGDTKVVFNGVVPKGLTLGDAEGAAVLELAGGTPVAVDGDLVIAGKGVDLTVSGLAVGNTYDVFTATGAVDAETAAKWAAIDVNGVPATAAYDAQVAENGGTTALQIVVRDPKDIPIEVAAAASETRSTNITWAVNDRLTTTVGEGGELRLEGELRKGFLVKDGLGTLTLSNPDSYLFNGVLFRLGTLNFDYPDDGTLADWMMTPDASSWSDVLRFTSDKSVSIRDLGVTSTGTLEISTADEIALGVPDVAQRRHTGFVRIDEGTLAIRGTGAGRANVAVSLPSGVKGSPVIIGHGGAGGEKAGCAKLVLDNVSYSGGISLASNINDSAALVNEAYLVVTNGSKATGSVTIFEESKDNLDAKVGILVDDATLSGSCEVKYNHLTTPPQITARNGSYLLGGWHFRGDADILVDASTMAGDDKGTPIVLGYYANWDFTNNFTFVNGSVFNAKALKCGWSGRYAYPAHFHLHFDDSEWKGMPDGFFGYVAPTDESVNPYVEVRVKDTGLKLNVPADATYSWAYPLMDESADVAGGFVKQGEGTLKVLKKTNPDGTFTDDFSFAHTGPTMVEAGVLDLNGNTWTRGTIGGGAGVVANGTLKSAKIALEIEDGAAKALPNFAADCVFDGRVKVDLGGANLPVGATFEVANYAGTAPSVANWKLIGNGETSGKFTAAGGVISAEVTPKPGLLMIVR